MYYFLDRPSKHRPSGAHKSYKSYRNKFNDSYDDVYSDDYCTENEYDTFFDYYDW